jgi:predicted lipid-binding transport protein (Tim44 family)
MSTSASRPGLASAASPSASRKSAVAAAPAAIERIRGQAAAARAVLDELDRATAPEVAEQLAEELSRLGARLLEVADALDRESRSGER